MAKTLSDLQHRDIHIRSELEGQGVIKLGLKVFNFLKDIKSQNEDIMCFFSHYFRPPYTPPHIKVCIRYETQKVLNRVNRLLDKLYQENNDIIFDSGNFKPTSGYDKLLPVSNFNSFVTYRVLMMSSIRAKATIRTFNRY